MAVVGNAEIRIQPTTTGFEAALRSQLTPILARVEAQFGSLFQRAGQTAANSFSQEFTRTLGSQIGGAVQQAATGRGVADAGRTAGSSFGTAVTQAAGTEITRNLAAGVQRATAGVQRQVQAAGEASGRTFGGGFGEGFAALAAFAIAAKVGRFFKETVTDAGAFADAMAGVRKNVEGTPEQFAAFEVTTKNLAEQLGISAAEIAGVGEEAGKLGTPIQNLAEATRTAVESNIALDISASEAAQSLVSLARLTDTPLSQISNLGSAVAELDATFGGSAASILAFSERAAAGLSRLGLSAPEILGVSAAFQEVGVRAESGSTALVRTIGTLQRLAAEGSTVAKALAEGLKLPFEEFQRLAEEDPAALFTRFLESVAGAGAQLEPILAELGLDANRLSRELGVGATSFDRIALGITSANRAFEENTRLQREVAIRQESSADQLRRLEEAFRNTRIEIGSKLAPVLIGILKPISELSTGTVALAATFAGLAAGAFAFVRFSNILKEFSKTLGGGALSTNELSIAMRIAQQQGTSLSNVLRIVKQEELSLVAAQEQLAVSGSKVNLAFQAQKVQALGFIGAFRAARAELIAESQAQLANAAARLQNARAIAAQRVASLSSTPLAALSDQLFINTQQLLRNAAGAQVAQRNLLGAGQAAFTAAGGFGALTSALGKASLILIAVDLFTQAERALHDFAISAISGSRDVGAITAELQKFAVGVGSIEEVLDEANIALSGFAGFGVRAVDDFTTGLSPLIGAFRFLGRTIEDTGIPVVEQLGGAIGRTSDAALSLLNQIPLFGRIITTEGERAEKAFEPLAESLDSLLQQAGPKVATAVTDLLTQSLRDQGVAQADINAGLGDFAKKLQSATEAQKALNVDADTARAHFEALGLEGEELTQAMAAFGIATDGATGSLVGIIGAADAAAGALQRLQAAQQAFQQRVSSLIVPVSGLLQIQQKLGKASKGAGQDTLRSARAIADAERALAEARRDAVRRLADAQRKLAEAEEDAADRIVEARRRIEDARLSSTRSLRDAQQELQDFERSLAVVGGPQTAEDEIRLRELRERLTDELLDARRAEQEGKANLAQVEEENTERIAEAQRRLREVHEENAEKIADALRRLARAHEDAANRQGAAADKMAAAAEKVSLSIAEITQGFQTEAGKLNTFSDLMATASERIFEAFGSRELGEAFLADLDEMGVAAIPILKNLVKGSDKELVNLGKAFEKQIKAAKKAADFQFEKFPPNFKQAIRPALDAVATELENGIAAFEAYGGATGPMAEVIEKNLADVAADFLLMLEANKIALTPQEQNFLDLANSAKDAGTRVDNLRKFIESLRSRVIDVTANLDFDIDTKALEKELKVLFPEGLFGPGGAKFGKTITGALAQAPKAMAGFTAAAGQPILVGKHTAEELFVPSTAGAIFKHTDTEKILRALRVSGGTVINNVQVNQVGEDPLATARAVSFRIGSDRAIR